MAVGFDAKMSGGNSTDGLNQRADNATTCSSTGTTVGGSATLLVGVIVYQTPSSSGNDPSSRTMTWNGVSMTERASVSSYYAAQNRYTRASVFTLVSPASGAQTQSAGWTSTADAYMSAVSFTGTDTTTGINTGDSTTATAADTITVTSDANGATVAVMGVDGDTPVVTTFTKIFAEAPLDPGGGASYTLGGTSNAHTFAPTTGTTKALAGIHIIAGAAGRATKNTRAFPLGMNLGMNWRV